MSAEGFVVPNFILDLGIEHAKRMLPKFGITPVEQLPGETQVAYWTRLLDQSDELTAQIFGAPPTDDEYDSNDLPEGEDW